VAETGFCRQKPNPIRNGVKYSWQQKMEAAAQDGAGWRQVVCMACVSDKA